MLLNLCTQIRLLSLFIMWLKMKCSAVCIEFLRKMHTRARAYRAFARQYRVRGTHTNIQTKNEQKPPMGFMLYLFNINDISFWIMTLMLKQMPRSFVIWCMKNAIAS